MTPVLLSLDSVGVDGTAIVTYTHLLLVLLFAFFYLFLRCIGFWGVRSDGWWSGRKRFHFTVFVYLFRRTGGGQHVFLPREEKEAEPRPVCRKNCNYEGYGLLSLAGERVFWLVCLSAALVSSLVEICVEKKTNGLAPGFCCFGTLLLLSGLSWDGTDGWECLLACLLAGIDMVQNRTQSVV